jgi:hypothetical protein
MKKIFNILIVFIIIFIGWSCSDKTMEEINKNVNDATDVESRYIITDAITSTTFSNIGADLCFYSSCYIEHNVGIYGQMYNAEIRSGAPTNSTTLNNTWTSIYQNLYNIKTIIKKCSDGGKEAGNYTTLGIAQILAALNLATLTDAFGDVPWSEALQPGVIFTPKIDKQEIIYNEIFSYLDNAIINLKKTSNFPSLAKQDLIYGGDASKWLKCAYGLKARYIMRLSFRSQKYADVIAYADSSFTSSSEQCTFPYNGATSISPYFAFLTDRNYFGSSQSLHSKLVSRNDPRDTIYFVAPPKATSLIFAPNGTPNQIQNLYGISGITNSNTPTFLMSYHEVEFLKAEAYARTGDTTNARIELIKGIKAAFNKPNVGLTNTAAEKYFGDVVKTNYASNPLSEIMIQKYLAFYEEESLEAYNDYRRLKAMGNNFITLSNPLNASKFPLRFAYGSSDVTTNPNIAKATGDGTYVYSENVWWAGGTR